MEQVINPFITNGYISPAYFCDRETESKQLVRELENGNNLALVSTRRMGKTGLMLHCFNHKEIKKKYYTFFVDIYATKSLRDFVFALSKVILTHLKPFGQRALEIFLKNVKSLQAGISFDVAGNPSFNIGLGDIQSSQQTLDEIFSYLNKADKPCIVAIDEFQQIANYAETNVEAMLRTHIQQCRKTRFIFSGSQRHIMGNMFLSASRPFYQSTSMLYLEAIALPKYTLFAQQHFQKGGKQIAPGVFKIVYEQFEGITWYIQKILNTLYSLTPQGGTCTAEIIPEAINSIINSYKYTYSETLFRLPEKQKELLIAIAKEKKTKAPTASDFVKKYNLASASSVQAAIRGLLDKDFITRETEEYKIYDQFFSMWLRENY
jgi:AAA+ ATPase superfamily predicted ATPase